MTQFGVNVNRKGWTGTIAQIYRANAAAYDGNGLGPHCAFFSGEDGNWSDTLKHSHVMGWGQNPNEKVPMFCAKVHTNSSSTR